MMTFAQIRSLAGYEPEQADEEARRALPEVWVPSMNRLGVLTTVDGRGRAVVRFEVGGHEHVFPFASVQEPA